MAKTNLPFNEIRPGNGVRILKRISRNIEKVIITALIIMMIGILILATIELGRTLYYSVVSSGMRVGLDGITKLFGGFLLVLIGIELLDTIKVYLKDNVIHVEVVLLVAIIALARKIVIYDIELFTGEKIIGLGVLIVSLAGAYYLIKKAGLLTFSVDRDKDEKDSNQTGKD